MPSFKTLQEWEPLKSTKMDTCARVVAHYLTDDNVQDVTFADGRPVFPELVKTRKDQIRQTRRIIIYAEFSSMAPLFQNVSTLRLCQFFTTDHIWFRSSASTESRA